MKVLVYVGEKKDFYGYKKVKFDFAKGTKIKLDSGKFAVSIVTAEFGENSFLLFKKAFREIKFSRNVSMYEKAIELAKFAMKYSGQEGEDLAKKIVEKFELIEKAQSDRLEMVMEKLENNI